MTDVAPQPSPNGQCGHNQYWNPAMGIVGGTDAKEFEFPSQVSIHSPLGFCGGSIIDDEWVLTAGHCCYSNASDYTIYYKLQISQTIFDAASEPRSVCQVNVHPNYQVNNNFYDAYADFCLLKVSTPFDFSNLNEAQPACLPRECSTSEVCQPGESMLAVGLGLTYPSGPVAETLLKTYQTMMTDSYCDQAYGQYWNREDGLYFCAFLKDQGMTGTCSGDSGGPSFCYKNGYLMIQGVTSWGELCSGRFFSYFIFIINSF